RRNGIWAYDLAERPERGGFGLTGFAVRVERASAWPAWTAWTATRSVGATTRAAWAAWATTRAVRACRPDGAASCATGERPREPPEDQIAVGEGCGDGCQRFGDSLWSLPDTCLDGVRLLVHGVDQGLDLGPPGGHPVGLLLRLLAQLAAQRRFGLGGLASATE